MASFSIPYDRCAVPGCGIRPTTWSRYCTRHTQRNQRTGHPELLLVRPVDLARHRQRIAQTLADLERAPAVIAAHEEAARLLGYRAPHGASLAARQWQDHVTRLRDWWTAPREIVQRSCEVFFLDQDGQFPDRRACEFTLARMVLRLRKLWGMKLSAPVLGFGGAMLHESFAIFALQMRKQTDGRSEDDRKRRDAMRSGWPTDSIKNRQ